MPNRSLDDFKNTFSLSTPPEDLSTHAKALWYAGKGDWNKSHEIVQDIDDHHAARIHAFLHRQEGDISNARYWYGLAGTEMPLISLEKEWEALVMESV